MYIFLKNNYLIFNMKFMKLLIYAKLVDIIIKHEHIYNKEK